MEHLAFWWLHIRLTTPDMTFICNYHGLHLMRLHLLLITLAFVHVQETKCIGPKLISQFVMPRAQDAPEQHAHHIFPLSCEQAIKSAHSCVEVGLTSRFCR